MIEKEGAGREGSEGGKTNTKRVIAPFLKKGLTTNVLSIRSTTYKALRSGGWEPALEKPHKGSGGTSRERHVKNDGPRNASVVVPICRRVRAISQAHCWAWGKGVEVLSPCVNVGKMEGTKVVQTG